MGIKVLVLFSFLYPFVKLNQIFLRWQNKRKKSVRKKLTRLQITKIPSTNNEIYIKSIESELPKLIQKIYTHILYYIMLCYIFFDISLLAAIPTICFCCCCCCCRCFWLNSMREAWADNEEQTHFSLFSVSLSFCRRCCSTVVRCFFFFFFFC